MGLTISPPEPAWRKIASLNEMPGEFFSGANADGAPKWADDIDRRQAVFEHRGKCLRSAITYNRGLRRYLWWQQLPQPAGAKDRGRPVVCKSAAGVTRRRRSGERSSEERGSCATLRSS